MFKLCHISSISCITSLGFQLQKIYRLTQILCITLNTVIQPGGLLYIGCQLQNVCLCYDLKSPLSSGCQLWADVTHFQSMLLYIQLWPEWILICFDHTLTPLLSRSKALHFNASPFASRPDRLVWLLLCYISYFFTQVKYVSPERRH